MKTLRTKPVYKLYFRYKNITLWKNKTITNLTKKKWMLLKASKTSILQYNRGIYLYHYKKLNLTRLYYYKFINKQLLKKYLTNYNESSFKSILLKNFQIFEKRLDFNLYQAHFVPSLYAARFFITKGYILVNKCVIKNTNFLLKAHDLVEINPKFWVNNFAIINKNKIFENKVTFLYLRNIEIDYTTLSFIFLDNKQFYIIQFENFIKKIYFNLNQKKLFNSTNKTNVLNNYFKFFETTFNYYLFLDESNKNLKYKIKTNNFRVLNLLKYLRFYYNDYFFRNILLKRIFSYKYNYLNYIINIANIMDCIVSLTTWKGRINNPDLPRVLFSIFSQETKYSYEVNLTLSLEEFPNKEKDLPEELLNKCKYGLEIKWCEDLKSYKKLVPALIEFPDSIIVTADDDLYYQPDWLKSLYLEYLKDPNLIYTRRATFIKIKNDMINAHPHYSNTHYKPCFNNQIMGGAGTLYPPHSLHKDVLDIDSIKSLIPTHDDIYFWAMAILNNKKIKLIKNKNVNLITVAGTQQYGLCKTNKGNSLGISPHEAFNRIFNKYPELVEILK